MPLEIINLLENPDKWEEFYSLPDAIYNGDPLYIPESVDSVKKRVERPEYENNQLPLIVMENGKCIARVIARISRELLVEDQPTGQLGMFEALDDKNAVKELFDHAINWFQGNSINRIIGPMEGDTWHKYRFNAGPATRPPFLMEPYNAPYYSRLWENYGFTILSSYYSKFVPDISAILPRFEKFYKRTLKQGFTYRPFDLDNYDAELEVLYDLSCKIFSRNFYYTPIGLDEFKSLYSGAKAIISPKFVCFCLDPNGNPCGFLFSFPDYFTAVHSMQGSGSIWAKLKFLLNKSKADTINIKTIGTLPELRRTGVGPALMYKAYAAGYENGYKQANMCLIHEENDSGRLDGDTGEKLRDYYLYQYIINEDKNDI